MKPVALVLTRTSHKGQELVHEREKIIRINKNDCNFAAEQSGSPAPPPRPVPALQIQPCGIWRGTKAGGAPDILSLFHWGGEERQTPYLQAAKCPEQLQDSRVQIRVQPPMARLASSTSQGCQEHRIRQGWGKAKTSRPADLQSVPTAAAKRQPSLPYPTSPPSAKLG